MGDMADIFNAHRDWKRERRQKFGVPCPKCAEVRPKAHPSILLPMQICKVDGYRDPRTRDAMYAWNTSKKPRALLQPQSLPTKRRNSTA